MFRNILLLLTVSALASCATTSTKHFTAISHRTSEIPRVYAWVADEELAIQMASDRGIFGVGVGGQNTLHVTAPQGATASQVAAGGILGAAIIGAIESSRRESAYESIEPIQDLLTGFGFEEYFQQALQDKIFNQQLLSVDQIVREASPERYSEWQSGEVSIIAYQRFTEHLSSLWTGLSVYRFDSTDEGEVVHRSAYLYEFKLPGSEDVDEDKEINLDIWLDNPALLEHMLKKGVAAAVDLMASDLTGNIQIETAPEVDINYDHLSGQVKKAHLISQSADRVIIVDKEQSLIASLPASAVEGSDAKQRTLVQIKQDEGIDDDAYLQKKNSPTRAAGSVQNDVGELQFMGQAEEEILSNTYDKNLWAKAFVDAEGDEQKRRAIYISLRAKQLYAKANPSSINAVTDNNTERVKQESDIDLTGTYTSKIGGFDTFYFTLNRLPTIKIRQKGNEVTGTIRPDIGEFSGIVEGDYVKINWMTARGMGKAKWKIERKGKKLKGTWRGNAQGEGSWVLKKKR